MIEVIGDERRGDMHAGAKGEECTSDGDAERESVREREELL